VYSLILSISLTICQSYLLDTSLNCLTLELRTKGTHCGINMQAEGLSQSQYSKFLAEAAIRRDRVLANEVCCSFILVSRVIHILSVVILTT
jgi:hypothetical protein